MKRVQTLLLSLSILLPVFNIFAQSSWYSDYVPSIPAERRVDWKNVGYNGEIPVSYNKIFYVADYGAIPNDGVDDIQSIQNTIEAARNYISANPGSIACVYLPQGTYNLTSGITFVNTSTTNYSNIILKGDGSDKTILSLPSSYQGKVIEISADITQTNSFQEIYAGYFRGDDIIYTNVQGFNVSDYVEIIDNFPLEFGNRGQIAKIKNKTGTQIILEDKLSISYDYGSNHPQIRKLTPIKNVGIEDIRIERTNRSGMGDNSIQFTYAANCWMQGVESSITYKYHVGITKSTSIEIRGSYFHHASGHGDGGIGYGVLIENHSTNCLVEDNLFDGLRHSMIVQSGANRNVFGYNYSWNREWESGTSVPGVGTGDISVHGNYAYANLFEGNKVDLIWADDAHLVMNGPYNTFFRNDVATNTIYLNQADYSNVLGNYANNVDTDGGPDIAPHGCSSNNVLDIAAKQYNQNGDVYSYTHSQYFFSSIFQVSSVCKDYSYYLDDEPSYFLSYSPPVTWPALGTTVLVGGYWPGATIPAYQRKISGGKYTVNGIPVPMTLSLG